MLLILDHLDKSFNKKIKIVRTHHFVMVTQRTYAALSICIPMSPQAFFKFAVSLTLEVMHNKTSDCQWRCYSYCLIQRPHHHWPHTRHTRTFLFYGSTDVMYFFFLFQKRQLPMLSFTCILGLIPDGPHEAFNGDASPEFRNRNHFVIS